MPISFLMAIISTIFLRVTCLPVNWLQLEPSYLEKVINQAQLAIVLRQILLAVAHQRHRIVVHMDKRIKAMLKQIPEDGLQVLAHRWIIVIKQIQVKIYLVSWNNFMPCHSVNDTWNQTDLSLIQRRLQEKLRMVLQCHTETIITLSLILKCLT